VGAAAKTSRALAFRCRKAELVRPAKIVPLIEERVRIVHRADFGGTLLHLPLADILVNFDPDDPKASLVDLMCLHEKAVIERGSSPANPRTWSRNSARPCEATARRAAARRRGGSAPRRGTVGRLRG